MGNLIFKSWVMGVSAISLAALAACSAAADNTPGGGTGGSGNVGGNGSPGGSGNPAGGAGNPAGGSGPVGPVVPTTCDGADCWTYLGHDAHSTFFNPLEKKLTIANVATLKEIWNADVGGSATGTAVVVGDTVYFKSSTDTRAFNRATGAMKWNITGGGSGSLAYDSGKLYVQRPNNSVLRLDIAAGAQEWSFGGTGPTNSIGSPLVTGNTVLAGTSSSDEFATFGSSSFKGRVSAIDKNTGKELWHHDTITGTGDGAPVWASPSVDTDAGMAFFASGNNYYTAGGDSDSIFALDLAKGTKLWAFQALANDTFNSSTAKDGVDADFGANPILFEAGGKKLVGAGAKSGTFYALDRMTGAKVWSVNLSDGCRLGGILNNGAYDGTRIYVASFPCTSSLDIIPILTPGTPVIAALDPATGNVIWKMNPPAQSWGPITVANGILFAPSQKTMQAINAATGDVLFKFDTAGSICSGAVVLDGQVFFGSGLPPSDAFSLGGATDGTVLHALALP